MKAASRRKRPIQMPAASRGAPRAQAADASEHIGVIVRLRPLSNWERKCGYAVAVAPQGEREVRAEDDRNGVRVCKCTRAFPSSTSQEAFFATSGIVPLIDACVDGFRSTAFARAAASLSFLDERREASPLGDPSTGASRRSAREGPETALGREARAAPRYGQTGAGKTYTMVGGPGSTPARGRRRQFHDGTAEGVLPRSLHYLFQRVSRSPHQCRVRLTCLEIYREVVTDLMAPEPAGERPSLAIREHPDFGFFVEGLRVAQCAGAGQAWAAVARALEQRQVGAHNLNERSSRSHAVITAYVDAQPQHGPTTYGSVSFVDLAGSERLKETGSGASRSMLKDAGHINTSLYTLGKVIRGLETLARARRKGTKPAAVPYRDSALTKLLISSLGGSCKTLMVACCSTASGPALGESLRTLDFAARVRGIKNAPRVHVDEHRNLVQRLREEVAQLRAENAALKEQLSFSQGIRTRAPSESSGGGLDRPESLGRPISGADWPPGETLEADADAESTAMLPTWESHPGAVAGAASPLPTLGERHRFAGDVSPVGRAARVKGYAPNDRKAATDGPLSRNSLTDEGAFFPVVRGAQTLPAASPSPIRKPRARKKKANRRKLKRQAPPPPEDEQERQLLEMLSRAMGGAAPDASDSDASRSPQRHRMIQPKSDAAREAELDAMFAKAIGGF